MTGRYTPQSPKPDFRSVQQFLSPPQSLQVINEASRQNCPFDPFLSRIHFWVRLDNLIFSTNRDNNLPCRWRFQGGIVASGLTQFADRSFSLHLPRSWGLSCYGNLFAKGTIQNKILTDRSTFCGCKLKTRNWVKSSYRPTSYTISLKFPDSKKGQLMSPNTTYVRKHLKLMVLKSIRLLFF